MDDKITHDDVSDQIEYIMVQGNEKLFWARKKANEFLEHANFLEERATQFRQLAGTMVIEAECFNDEIAELLLAEFPMESDGISDDETDDADE